MAHQSTDHCVWNCLESVSGMPYELSSNTDPEHKYILDACRCIYMYMYVLSIFLLLEFRCCIISSIELHCIFLIHRMVNICMCIRTHGV